MTVAEFNATLDAFARYRAAKAENPNAVILVRSGDKYQAYEDSAAPVSKGWASICSNRLGTPISQAWDAQNKRNVMFTRGPASRVDVCVDSLERAGHTVVLC